MGSIAFPQFVAAAGCPASAESIRSDGKTWSCQLKSERVNACTYYKKPYDLSAFGNLVRADFEGARMLADQLQDKSLRASALYEACAGILRKTSQDKKESNPKDTPAKQIER